MAPIKQEEQMQDKLEKRRLQPSAESWKALANRLDAEEKNKNRTWFWWIGIAASIVGILFVTTVYFNNQPIENDTQIIVDSKEHIKKEKQEKFANEITEITNMSDSVVLEKVESEKISTKKSTKESIANSNVKTTITENISGVEKLSKQDALAQIKGRETPNAITSRAVEKPTKIDNAELNFENQKIQEVVAQINNLKENGNQVSDAEIDNLLKKAQKEILSNKLFYENTRTVDANALLRDVEEDLQQSFRSKVFEILQTGYESVKTAVAERNN